MLAPFPVHTRPKTASPPGSDSESNAVRLRSVALCELRAHRCYPSGFESWAVALTLLVQVLRAWMAFILDDRKERQHAEEQRKKMQEYTQKKKSEAHYKHLARPTSTNCTRVTSPSPNPGITVIHMPPLCVLNSATCLALFLMLRAA
eukprot:792690-Amphidinium_carterae.1